MIYRCSKCGYNTKHKSHFNSHMNKLYPCSNEVVVYTKEDWNSCQEKINDSINIDINELIKKITPRTKVIMAVHVLGNSSDIEKIKNICKKKI